MLAASPVTLLCLSALCYAHMQNPRTLCRMVLKPSVGLPSSVQCLHCGSRVWEVAAGPTVRVCAPSLGREGSMDTTMDLHGGDCNWEGWPSWESLAVNKHNEAVGEPTQAYNPDLSAEGLVAILPHGCRPECQVAIGVCECHTPWPAPPRGPTARAALGRAHYTARLTAR